MALYEVRSTCAWRLEGTVRGAGAPLRQKPQSAGGRQCVQGLTTYKPQLAFECRMQRTGSQSNPATQPEYASRCLTRKVAELTARCVFFLFVSLFEEMWQP